MWDEEVDMARNQLMKSRESFGLTFSGGDDELLLGDDDTRDLSLAAQDLTDQFFAQTQRERSQGAMDIGDITSHSGKGFDDPGARESVDDQIQGDSSQLRGAQGSVDASRAAISTRISGLLRPTDPSGALGDELRGSKYGSEDPSGRKQSRLVGSDDIQVTRAGRQGQDKDMDVDLNDGWEDIPDDELTQDFLSQLESQASATADLASGIVDKDDRRGTPEGRDLSADHVDAVDAEILDKEGQDLAGVHNEDQDMEAVNDDEQEAGVARLNELTLDVDEQLGDAEGSPRDVDGRSPDAEEKLGEVDVHLDEPNPEQLGELDVQNLDVDEQLHDAEETHRDDEEQNLDVNEQLDVEEQLDETERQNLDGEEHLDLDEQLDEVDGRKPDVDEQLNDVDDRRPDVNEQNQDIPAAALGDGEGPLFINDDREDISPRNDIEYEDGYMNVLEEDHIEQQEHEEQHGKAGVEYFDDFPSELGIMSNGNILRTSAPPKPRKVVR